MMEIKMFCLEEVNKNPVNKCFFLCCFKFRNQVAATIDEMKMRENVL